jgi:hypothetical protein
VGVALAFVALSAYAAFKGADLNDRTFAGQAERIVKPDFCKDCLSCGTSGERGRRLKKLS